MVTIKSRALLAAAAIALTGAGLATPAAAKDKPAQGPVLSETFRKAAIPAQEALKANNPAAAEPAVAAAEAAAQSDDEKYFASSARLQLEAQKLQPLANNPTAYAQAEIALVKPLDQLLANPKTPAADIAHFTYLRGKASFDLHQYDVASTYLQKAQTLGYTDDPDLALEITQAQVQGGNTAAGVANLEKMIEAKTAAGQKAPEDWYAYAVGHLQAAHDQAGEVEWLKRWVTAYPTAKNWRNAIVVFGFPTNQPQLAKGQAVDLFRLMRKLNALADQNDYAEYSQDAVDLGLSDEAVKVIDEGRANGKIPAGNASIASIYSQAKKGSETAAALASLATRANAAPNGKLAQQTADAYLGRGEYDKAAALYKTALQKGGVTADDVNTHLGIALASTGDKAGAQAAFAAVQGMPRKQIASFWTMYLDNPPTA